ncbi:MAG: hypothetical protein JSR77_17160 [Planctomycetes bacterium]|nr:hypothetical protein [Planctomycetota bacterium]
MNRVAQTGLAIAVVSLIAAAINLRFGLVPDSVEVWFYIGVFFLCQVGGALLLLDAMDQADQRRRAHVEEMIDGRPPRVIRSAHEQHLHARRSR